MRALLVLFMALAACGSTADAGQTADAAAGGNDGSAPSANDAASPGNDARAADAATGDGHAADAHPADATPPPPPDVDHIPWQTGAGIGFGVAMKDTENPLGENIFVGYAGYGVALDWAEAWVTALYKSALAQRGVRYIWAVQGPSNPSYSGFEIGNSKVVATMLPLVTSKNKFVLVAGHSSGTFVAHEMLGQLAGGADPQNVTAGRVVYFDLDGGETGLSDPIVARLRRAHFVASRDGATGTDSPNMPTMQSLGARYPSAGGYWQNDASASGCATGAPWCVHVTLITTRPHDPNNASPQADYSDFSGRAVSSAYIGAKAGEAGLVP